MANSSSHIPVVNNTTTKNANKLKNTEKPKNSHPSTATMVHAAISTLNDRQGSSIPSIMKYIESNYQVDIQKLKVHMKRYMKKAVAEESLVQTKGHGFTGSFKLLPTSKKVKVDKKKAEKASSKKQTVQTSVKLPETDIAAKKLKKSSKTTSTKKLTVKNNRKANTEPQEKVPVPKKTAVVKKLFPSTPENPKKAKKIRSPVVKKTPRPKRITKAKAAN